MNKIYILVFLLAIILPTLAYACSWARVDVIDVKCDVNQSLFDWKYPEDYKLCLNEDCSINLGRRGEYYMKYYDMYLQYSMAGIGDVDYALVNNFAGIGREKGMGVRWLNNEEKSINASEQILSALKIVCIQNIDDLEPIFTEEMSKWYKEEQYSSRNSLLQTGLSFEPYSQALEDVLKKQKNNLYECRYPDYKRAGAWFIINDKARDYCDFVNGIPCGGFKIYHSLFIFYLFTHPSLNSLSYLLPYLTIIIIFFLFFRYLQKRKELGMYFVPNATIIFWLISLNVIFLFLLLGFFTVSLEECVYVFIGTYLLLCVIKYIIIRSKQDNLYSKKTKK